MKKRRSALQKGYIGLSESFEIVSNKKIRFVSIKSDQGKEIYVRCFGHKTAATLCRRLIDLAGEDAYPFRCSLEFGDTDYESHYVPIKFEFQNWGYVSISFEQVAFLIDKSILVNGCKEYLQNEYLGMGI